MARKTETLRLVPVIPWRPCTRCGSVTNPHEWIAVEKRYNSWCVACRRAARRRGEHNRTLGHPDLTHRHACEICYDIFNCKPCPHFPTWVSTDELARICPRCQSGPAA